MISTIMKIKEIMKRGKFLLALAIICVMGCATAQTKTAATTPHKADTAKVDTTKVTFHKIVKQTKTELDSMGNSMDKSTERFRRDGKQAWKNAKKETKGAAKAVKDFFKDKTD